MSRKSLDKELARAVQDAVVRRRGGIAPAYQHCLTLVRDELVKLEGSPRQEGWKDLLIARVAQRTQ